MNSMHDLGGMDGHGPIEPKQNGLVFHDEWEKRVFGMFMACFAGGHFNVDEFRHSRERMNPVDYLKFSYYEHWLASVETLMTEKGVISKKELDERKKRIEMESV